MPRNVKLSGMKEEEARLAAYKRGKFQEEVKKLLSNEAEVSAGKKDSKVGTQPYNHNHDDDDDDDDDNNHDAVADDDDANDNDDDIGLGSLKN
ncbi:hypothetical protein PV326_006598 [Microctonus aethiopoides]|nr:hypothetical protein PV326_006598 [Microctonus aethiopoides]